jgi:hypothetical protein
LCRNVRGAALVANGPEPTLVHGAANGGKEPIGAF